MEKGRNNKIIADRLWCALLAVFITLNCIESLPLMDGFLSTGVLFYDLIKDAVCAALIGGAADWFAVKALFEKIGPFPHTDILRRERRTNNGYSGISDKRFIDS